MNPAVGLVESYLRLNGFFTVTEFQVQYPLAEQAGRYDTATDLDILAVRLPHAAETVLRHSRKPGEARCEIAVAEDPALGLVHHMPDILIAEVKEGAAALNAGLLRVDVLQAALRRIGCCPEDHIGEAVEALRHRGEFIVEQRRGIPRRIRLASFAGRIDESPPPAALAITFAHILDFIAHQMHAYREIWRSAQFGDPALALLKLADKLGLRLAPVSGSDRS